MDGANWPRRLLVRGRIPSLWRTLALAAMLFVAACAPTASTRPSVKPTPTHPVVTGIPTYPIVTNDTRVVFHHGRPYIIENLLDATIAHMSLDEKLGQLFIAEFVGTDYNENNAIMVEQLHAGGLLVYAMNMTSADQTRALISTAQKHAKIPLLAAVDEEGGWVDRLQQIYGFRPSASQIGASGSVTFAQSEGARAGHDMAALGLNFDFAPDVDVGLVQGADLRSRVFGSTPDAVTKFAGAYLTGLQSNGHVAGTLKHFPGLGSVLGDAHLDLPTVSRTRPELNAVELAPYRALIASGHVLAIMPTDVLVPVLDPKLPAELSPATIDGVLRKELGFDGVVVTDALYMAGISKTYSMEQAGVMAIEAGDDLLVGPAHPGEIVSMINALKAAINSGQLSVQRIDQSVKRILLLKIKIGLMKMPQREIPYAPPLPVGLH
jgi:beta-N-acetylhexosaminidase